jgi:hypothetical protein
LGLALSACDGRGNAPQPGDMTAGEARALDEAAEMLDERRLSDQSGSTAEESAEDAAPGGEG